MGKVKLGVCQWCIPAQGVQAIALAGELGFAGVEMDMGIGKPGLELREEAVLDAFITAKEKTGLVYPALALNGIEMNQPQAEEETLALILRAVQIARQLGADTLQMPSFGSAQMESETDFEQTVKALRFACDQAPDLQIGSENTLGIQGNQRLLEQVNRDNFFIYYDGANIENIRGEDGVAFYTQMAGAIRQAHAKDLYLAKPWQNAQPAVLGEGECHAREILETMRAFNFSGWIFVENGHDRERLKRDLEMLKRYFV
ncbi:MULTISPECIES: sugar phosphate isomerase/epimerase family protein [unclassified Clostridium]|uniref:sugar phosphate isomerase/epimerase family protein n=1 Tax=Clostridium sp. BSD2780061688st1 E8 TaxID=2559704 RepID=UPI001106EE3A|nr:MULTISPECIES: sugar phosphate isomerase/epimerase family protein [unclassified Clostridium]